MEYKTGGELGNSETSFAMSVEGNECVHRTETEDKTETAHYQTVEGKSINISTNDGTCNEESGHTAKVDVETSELVDFSQPQNAIEAVEDQKLGSIKQGAVGGSEETFDTVCEACLEEEKHVEAFMYCVECEEYLCEHCVTMHRGVRLTRGHKLVSKQAIHDKNISICMDKKEECPLHISEYLEWFCKTDFSVGCTVCKSTVHGKCRDVIPISEAVSSLLVDQKVEETVTKLETMKTAIRFVICKGQIRQENLAKDRCESLKELAKIKRDIEKAIEFLDNLMQEDETRIEEKYLEINQSIENDVHQFGKIENALDRSISTLKDERLNDEYKFIHVIKAEENLKLTGRTLTDFEKETSFPGIAYERDKSLDKKLDSINKVGYIDQDKGVFSVIYHKEIPVTRGFEKSCDIRAICVVDSCRVLLADWKNNSLKLVNTTDESVTHVTNLGQSPFDICRVGEEERFAVTLLHGREVKFVETSGDSIIHSSQNSIRTVEKCRGVAYHNSRLFVLCGGGTTDNEGHGHIRVYTLDGVLQKTIIQDGRRTIINNPRIIRIRPNTDMAFLTDGNKILQMNLNNFEIDTVIENLPSRVSLCFDSNGRIIYLNYERRTVELLARNNKQSMKLLKLDDVSRRPRYVAYNPASATLFVTLEDSQPLLCFSVKKNEWNKAPSF